MTDLDALEARVAVLEDALRAPTSSPKTRGPWIVACKYVDMDLFTYHERVFTSWEGAAARRRSWSTIKNVDVRIIPLGALLAQVFAPTNGES